MCLEPIRESDSARPRAPSESRSREFAAGRHMRIRRTSRLTRESARATRALRPRRSPYAPGTSAVPIGRSMAPRERESAGRGASRWRLRCPPPSGRRAQEQLGHLAAGNGCIYQRFNRIEPGRVRILYYADHFAGFLPQNDGPAECVLIAQVLPRHRLIDENRATPGIRWFETSPGHDRNTQHAEVLSRNLLSLDQPLTRCVFPSKTKTRPPMPVGEGRSSRQPVGMKIWSVAQRVLKSGEEGSDTTRIV